MIEPYSVICTALVASKLALWASLLAITLPNFAIATPTVLSTEPAVEHPIHVYYAGPATYLKMLSRLQPGDTLILQPGTYDKPRQVPGLAFKNMHGTAQRPITVRGPEYGPKPILLGRSTHNTIRFINASYIILRNIVVNGRNLGGDGVNAQGISHNITLDNLEIYGVGTNQQVVGISTKASAWNWHIKNCTIVHAGTGIYLGNSDGEHPFVGGIIEHNLIKDSIGYNLQIKHQNKRPEAIGLPTAASTTIIRHNVFTKSANSAIGPLARPNLLVGHFPTQGAGMHDHYEIYGNFFYHNPSEALFQGEGNIAFYNNLLVNQFGPGVHIQPHNDSPRDVDIFHNTIVAKTNGIRVIGGAILHDQQVIANAVFAQFPISGGNQQDNITDTEHNAAQYLNKPSANIPHLDLFPKPNKLRGAANFMPSLNRYTDAKFDFNTRPRTGVYRGAYAGEETNPGWHPTLNTPPLRDPRKH